MGGPNVYDRPPSQGVSRSRETVAALAALAALRHHLIARAGRSDTLLSDDATALIHQALRGYPRAASNLTIRAL